MKFLFDPKWLPALKEVEVPVMVVGAPEFDRALLDDIRRMHRDLPILEAPLVPFFTPTPLRFSDPLIGYDPANNGTAVIANGFQSLKFVTPASSIDLSECGVPESKSAINKALRKKRDAQKASQNAKGRKWWEHR